MATFTHQAVLNSTTGGTSMASPSFTPPAGGLLVVAFSPSGVTGFTPTVTASANGITFTRVTSAIRASVDDAHLFVADQLTPGSPVAMTVTISSGSNATGHIGWVTSLSSMSRVGLDAVRNFNGNPNAAAVASTTTFGSAALTANPVLTFMWNATNPAGMTPPTSFTEPIADVGYGTPTRGGSYAVRNSGHTSATVTWGSASATASVNIAAEFDTSAASGTDQALTGVVDATTSNVGVIAANLLLAGMVAASSSLTGVIDVDHPLTGSIAASSSVSGSPTSRQSVGGTVAATTTTAAAPTLGRSLNGATAGSSTASGAPTSRQGLTAAVNAATGTAATFDTPGTVNNPLVGNVVATTGAAGTIRLKAAAVGTVAATTATVGTMGRNTILTGQASGTTSFTGTATVRLGLAGTVEAVSLTVGAIAGDYPLTGAVDVVTSVAGTLTPDETDFHGRILAAHLYTPSAVAQPRVPTATAKPSTLTATATPRTPQATADATTLNATGVPR